MKRFIPMVIVGVTLLSGVAVYAQTASSSPLQKRTESRQEIQKLRNEVRSSTTEERKQFQDEREKLQKEMKNTTSTQERSALKLEIEKARQTMLEKIKKQTDDLKVQVKKIKDTQKQETVLSVHNSLAALNTKVTDQLLQTTDKLGVILGNITSRASKMKAGGIDVTSIDSMIQTAQNAIQAAQTAIKAQAVKIYPITISGTGTAVQSDVVKARQSLMTDLTATRAVVQKARESVQTVATTLAKLTPATNATSTATTTQ